jgi:hypothetical protein
MEYDTERLYYSHQQLHAHPPTTTGGENNNNDNAENGNNNRPPPAAGAGGAMMDGNDDEDNINMDACRRHFREFLRTFIVLYTIHSLLVLQLVSYIFFIFLDAPHLTHKSNDRH